MKRALSGGLAALLCGLLLAGCGPKAVTVEELATSRAKLVNTIVPYTPTPQEETLLSLFEQGNVIFAYNVEGVESITVTVQDYVYGVAEASPSGGFTMAATVSGERGNSSGLLRVQLNGGNVGEIELRLSSGTDVGSYLVDAPVPEDAAKMWTNMGDTASLAPGVPVPLAMLVVSGGTAIETPAPEKLDDAAYMQQYPLVRVAYFEVN